MLTLAFARCTGRTISVRVVVHRTVCLSVCLSVCPRRGRPQRTIVYVRTYTARSPTVCCITLHTVTFFRARARAPRHGPSRQMELNDTMKKNIKMKTTQQQKRSKCEPSIQEEEKQGRGYVEWA